MFAGECRLVKSVERETESERGDEVQGKLPGSVETKGEGGEHEQKGCTALNRTAEKLELEIHGEVG